MKKNIMLLLLIVSIFTFGSAFAANRNAPPEASGKLFNGITYFEPSPASTCEDAIEKEPVVKMFNGITAFEEGQPVSGANNFCACRQAKEPMMSRSYNGITVF